MIEFVDVDAKKIFDDMVISVQNALNEVLYPGDERRLFLEQQAQIIVAIYNALNDSAKQNLLRYARGELLDAIGESTDTIRLPAEKATSTIRFSIAEARTADTIIPKSTRVTPDGVLFFETIIEGVVSSGNTYVDIDVIATEPGTDHNGFTSGQIDKLVDIVPFISQVSNITTCLGGTNIEADDDGVNVWSGYRERIRLSKSKISTAGHELGYIYYAKSADANIGDVIATSPSAGEILITAIMKDGSIPTQSILDKIQLICSEKTVRPMTDKVTVTGPTQISFNTNLTYYISEDNATNEQEIKTNVDEAIKEYEAWQSQKIGRDINPDKLRQLMLNAGASRIMITAPTYLDIGITDIGKIGTKTITYGGLE